MAEAVITLDTALLAKEARKLDIELGRLEQIGIEAQARAIHEYGEDWLSDAIKRAPVKTGALRAAGDVTSPEDVGDGTRVRLGFNIVYAAIQDKGGIIKPVRAKMLFIPLVEGATPGDPDLVWGKDFVLVDQVELKGNQYLTGQIPDRQENMAPAVGRRMFEIMRGSRPSG